ncbi:MAG TPA: sigma factor-like helix-turn-helix DNA-binding protein [Solirubrobacteraceae bacterium]|nr:sigma factor-like helix-turn-helix DNA-binding protein [Solirubrobacteraceae bacterium]
MDELRRFCLRMLRDGSAAEAAAAQAAGSGGGDRLAALQSAIAECRRVTDAGAGAASPPPAARAGAGLATAVAGELASATGRLAAPERELLALRDLLDLSYGEIAAVTGSESDTVAARLAEARLRLRRELRGSGIAATDCPERERALRSIAARQDDEPAAAADGDWLIEHLGHCRGCGQIHAAMLEATACYRGWGAAEGAGAVADFGP